MMRVLVDLVRSTRSVVVNKNNMNSKINLIRKCEWEEVFLTWHENEGKSPNWINLAKERGFASWADWRLNGYAKKFECSQADWGFYEVSDPAEVVSGWFGGPFRTWIEKHYNHEKTKSFAELISQSDISEQAGVKFMTENYPVETVITALELNDGSIYVIEGMHRACALALMSRDSKVAPERLVFAIGKSKLSELPPVGQNSL